MVAGRTYPDSLGSLDQQSVRSTPPWSSWGPAEQSICLVGALARPAVRGAHEGVLPHPTAVV